MLCVAFSRRMCCSRVCSVSTKPRRPSTSRVSPAIRPGILRRKRSAAAKNPNDGPPKSSRLPSVWPSPTQMSTPCSPGGFRMPSGSGSAAHTTSAPVRPPGLGQLAELLDRAQEVGLLDEHGGGVVVDRGGERLDVRGALGGQRHLLDLHPEADRVRAQRSPRVRVQPAASDQLRALGLQLRQVARGRHGARALVHRRVRHRQPGQLRDRGLELEHHLQPALRDLRLVRRVRRQELRARQQVVDQRRDVVVVHARAQERSPRRRRGGCAPPARPGARAPPAPTAPGGRSISRSSRTDSGMSANRSSSEPAPMAPSIASRSCSVIDVYRLKEAPCRPSHLAACPPRTGSDSRTFTIQPSAVWVLVDLLGRVGQQLR